MSDLVMDVASIDWQGHVGTVVQADKRVVEFYQGSELHGVRSEAEGRPIYVAVDMIRIRHPGERDVHEIPVLEHHKHEFRRKWEAYKAGQAASHEGTPLATLFPVEQAIVRQMNALHIFTAEQLAGLTEQGISRLGLGGRQHVERAKKFLEASGSMAGAHRMEGELRAAQEKLAESEARMAAMERQLQVLAAAQDKPRRRARETIETIETDEQE
jgi:hypothetical protein